MSDKVTSIDAGRPTNPIGAWLLGGLFALVVGLLVGTTWDSQSRPLWFIGLLIVFTAVLTLVAAVFRWLNLDSREEAFGMPPGTIRTLLAVGVMVLFAYFGLTFLQNATNGLPAQRVGELLRVVEVDPKKVDDEIKRYEKLNLAALPVAPVAGAASAPVRMELYRQEAHRPADVVDMQKQIITAVATLLTTVIGFYFGSRGSEGPRQAKRRDPGADDSDAIALVADATDSLKRWDELKAETPPAALLAAFGTLKTQIEPAALRLSAARDALPAGAPPDAVKLGVLRAELQAFSLLLAAAQRLVAKE